MRIDPDECRDPDLLAAEVRRLRTVIAAGEPTLTAEERKAIDFAADFLDDRQVADTLRSLLQRLGGNNG